MIIVSTISITFAQLERLSPRLHALINGNSRRGQLRSYIQRWSMISFEIAQLMFYKPLPCGLWNAKSGNPSKFTHAPLLGEGAKITGATMFTGLFGPERCTYLHGIADRQPVPPFTKSFRC